MRETDKVSEHQREHSGTLYDVTNAVAGPRAVYRATIPVTLAVPTPETTIAFDASHAALAGSFDSRDEVVAGGSLAQHGDIVVATLPEAREVRGVAFVSRTSFANTTVQLFRLDEDTVAPQPTTTSGVGSGNAASFGTGDFADLRFGVGVDGKSVTLDVLSAVTVRGYPTGARLGLLDAGGNVTFFWPGPHDTGDEVAAGAAFAAALQAFMGGRSGGLETTLVIQSDQPCTFWLRQLATGATFTLDGFGFPRLGPGDLLEVDALATRIAAAADPVSAHLRPLLHGAASLEDGLNAVIAGAALYDAQRFAGVTLSAATQAALTAGDVARSNRLLLQDAYPDAIAAPDADRVLQFGGGSAESRQVTVSLPAGARVSKATITTDASVRGDRAAVAAVSAASGVHVADDGAVAVSVPVDTATSVTGLALPLFSLSTGTKVSLELQEDWHGFPSGKRLAAATTAALPAGSSALATVFFPAVVVPAGSVWVVARASHGRAVLLTEPAASDLSAVRTPDGGPAVETSYPACALPARLFTRSGAAAEEPAVSLAVGSTAVSAAAGSYDLTAALTALGGGAAALTFTCAVPGTVTVHPPHVEYAL